jgi:hypothetical protein
MSDWKISSKTSGQYYKLFTSVISPLAAYSSMILTELCQWKGINRNQSTWWQHLSGLKASVFFSLQNFLVVMKHSNLYLGLVLPSGG